MSVQLWKEGKSHWAQADQVKRLIDDGWAFTNEDKPKQEAKPVVKSSPKSKD